MLFPLEFTAWGNIYTVVNASMSMEVLINRIGSIVDMKHSKEKFIARSISNSATEVGRPSRN